MAILRILSAGVAPVSRSAAGLRSDCSGLSVIGLPPRHRGDDVSRVPAEAGLGTVVAHGSARVSVGGAVLDVSQRDPGIEGRGDERVTQGVRADVLGDLGPAWLPGVPSQRRLPGVAL
jgi:hypothetical protein